MCHKPPASPCQPAKPAKPSQRARATAKPSAHSHALRCASPSPRRQFDFARWCARARSFDSSVCVRAFAFKPDRRCVCVCVRIFVTVCVRVRAYVCYYARTSTVLSYKHIQLCRARVSRCVCVCARVCLTLWSRLLRCCCCCCCWFFCVCRGGSQPKWTPLLSHPAASRGIVDYQFSISGTQRQHRQRLRQPPQLPSA